MLWWNRLLSNSVGIGNLHIRTRLHILRSQRRYLLPRLPCMRLLGLITRMTCLLLLGLLVIHHILAHVSIGL